MKSLHCAAIDLGATSGRVIVGTWAKTQLALTEIHRFPNQFRPLGQHEYWDITYLWDQVRTGLTKAKEQFPHIASVGVDTWGVDYALVDKTGRLVFPVHAYRDNRTQAGLKRLAAKGISDVYAATGIPNVFYNSSLQLEEAVASCPKLPDLAARCLFLPDYFNFLLSGRMENELTIASTTQLLDVRGTGWSKKALKHFGIPPKWFSEPILSGTKLGKVRGLPGYENTTVVAVPGHDTAAAYDAMPANPDGTDIYISSGTWSLVGFESDKPVLGPEALEARVANERIGDGRYRPLTNVIGLWLLEQTLREFASRPQNDAEWAKLVDAAEKLSAPKVLLEVNDPVFGNPPSMRAAIDAQLKKKKGTPPTHIAGYLRLICDSLGLGHARAIQKFETLAKRKFNRVLIVGGGSKNRLLCQATADASGLPVVSFQLEGTAVGNLASQLISLGAVKDLATFRRHLGRGLSQKTYQPRTS